MAEIVILAFILLLLIILMGILLYTTTRLRRIRNLIDTLAKQLKKGGAK